MASFRLRSVAIGTCAGLAIGMAIAPSAPARPVVLAATYDLGTLQAGEAAYVVAIVGAADEPTMVEDVSFANPGSPFWIDGDDCVGEPMDVSDLCTVGVVFEAPDADGDFEDTLTVRAEDGSVATAMVQGTSYRAGGLTPEPAQVEWVGGMTRQSVVLRNRTTEPLWIDSVAATLPFVVVGTTRCANAIHPGATCSISVAPGAGATDATGTLAVRHAGAVSFAGDLTPAPPYSTLSIPLVKRPLRRATRPPSSRPVPMPLPDYSSVEVDLANLVDAIPRLIRGGPRTERLLPRFKAPATGTLSLTLFGWNKGGRAKLGGGSLELQGWSSDHLGFRLNKKGSALLRRPRRTRVQAVLKFTPVGAAGFRQGSKFFVKGPKKKRKR